MEKVIGRHKELKELLHFLTSKKAEFMAIYGRRRIGKTFLIKNFFKTQKCIFFDVTGIKNGTYTEQINEFVKKVGEIFYGGAALADKGTWWDAFDVLNNAISAIDKRKKIVIFLDEFPWMATKKSRLLQVLEHTWNNKWNWNNNIRLVVCGSSASWILKRIINNTGGLYNRVTARMELHPFNLYEAKQLLSANWTKLSNQQILEVYMVTGGIPLYLNHIEKGLSAQQNINQLCFERGGFLRDEFTNIFASLFDDTSQYLDIIKTISQHRNGISKNDLVKICNLSSGGRASGRLKDLEEAGFITSFIPYGHKERGIYYKIIDEYTLFYFHWIDPNKTGFLKITNRRNAWQHIAQSPDWKAWSGYAFEAICYKHIEQIVRALNIDSIFNFVGAWKYTPKKGSKNDLGAQIDLLFDRNDNVITICEIKYSYEPFVIDKQYAANLRNKVEVYKKHTGTHKQIFIAMISANGLKPTMYSEELVSGCAVLDDLFKE